MTASIGAFVSLLSSFKWVKEGEIGVVTTFGKAKRDNNGQVELIESGFKLVFPIVQQINKVHIKKNTARYSDLAMTLENGLSFNLDAFIIYHVKTDPKSIENVLFGLEDYNEYVTVTFEKSIQKICREANDLDFNKMNELIFTDLKPVLDKEGIELDDCGLVSANATGVSQALLGIKYKLEKAYENYTALPSSILSAILGSVPVAWIEEPKSFVESKNQEE